MSWRISGGIGTRFFPNSSISRFSMSRRVFGTKIISLLLRLSHVRLDSCAIAFGMEVILLLLRSSLVRLDNCPSDSGMEVISLLSRSSLVRLDNCPNDSGMEVISLRRSVKPCQIGKLPERLWDGSNLIVTLGQALSDAYTCQSPVAIPPTRVPTNSVQPIFPWLLGQFVAMLALA